MHGKPHKLALDFKISKKTFWQTIFLGTKTGIRQDFFPFQNKHFYNFEYLCSIDVPCQNSAKYTQWLGEEVDFVIFAIIIFSIGSHLGDST